MGSRDALDDVTVRLNRRLERERRARHEAEAIAERGLRALFGRQQELLLLATIGEVANVSSTVEETMQFAIERFCEFAGWRVGHLCLAVTEPEEQATAMVPTPVWFFATPDRYELIRVTTEPLRFPAGHCLPGRVLATGTPVWIPDVRRDPDFCRSHAVAASGLTAAFGVPIRVAAEVAGVLEFFGEESAPPDEDLLRFVGQLGTHLGRVIERKRSADRLIDAYHDPLTQLPNRSLLLDDLDLAIRRGKRHEDYLFAVLFLDLDRFKIVNDSLGHLAGDRLIVEFARRISASVRRPDMSPPKAGFQSERPDSVARLGGDEFVILLDDITDASDAVRVAERVLRALEVPFDIDGHAVLTSASIGIALSATGYEAAQDILRDADGAMYRAKTLGGARYVVFDPAMHTRAVARLQLEADLRLGLERDEFRLHYQPIVSLGDRSIVGFEALVRWQHPERGLVMPGEFIPVAEETGLIQAIGRWTLQEACAQLQRWRALEGGESLTVAVNLSAKQFAHPNLIPFIDDVLRATGLPGAHLVLELTESMTMEHPERSPDVLRQLRQRGLRIAIDDFGTGFSSLSYLHRFPIDSLKIDGSFVSRMEEDRASREIVRAIIALASALNLRVVAEGIESASQCALLRELGTALGQGYHFSRPRSGEEATSLLTEGWTGASGEVLALA